MFSRRVSKVGLGLFLFLSACDRKPTEPRPRTEPSQEAPVAAPRKPVSPAGPAATPRRNPARPTAGLNVILLTIDSWGGEAFVSSEQPVTPRLSDLGKAAIVYEAHRSVSGSTPEALSTLLSGRLPSTLDRSTASGLEFADSNIWISEAMSEKGVRTLAVHSHPELLQWGMRQGFSVWKSVEAPPWIGGRDSASTSQSSVEGMIALLQEEKNTAGQFFLWSHLTDPHPRYFAHEQAPDFGAGERGRYLTELWWTDRWIGSLLDFCQKQPWWQRTAVIITADHGMSGKTVSSSGRLRDESLRVPLVIRAPGASAKKMSAARSHLDLAPTILELMQVPRPVGMQGQTMAAEIYDEEAASPRELVALQELGGGKPAARGMVDGGYKLVQESKGHVRLYDLKTDPKEVRDLSRKNETLVSAFSSKLEVYFSKLPLVEPSGSTTASKQKHSLPNKH